MEEINWKCECCNATTNESPLNFIYINWNAFKEKNKRLKCYCPIHEKEFSQAHFGAMKRECS